jgi:hypothetical protein
MSNENADLIRKAYECRRRTIGPTHRASADPRVTSHLDRSFPLPQNLVKAAREDGRLSWLATLPVTHPHGG